MNAVNGREKISSETLKIASQKFKKNIKTQKKWGKKRPTRIPQSTTYLS